MEKQQSKNKFNFSSYGVVAFFLLLEILAFVSFGLGHSFVFYGILSLVILTALVLVTFRDIKIKGTSSFALFILPLFSFSLITAISSFASRTPGAYNITTRVFVPITLLAFALIGYLSTLTNGFSLKKIIIVVYSSLALYVFLNFVFTMFNFVPFYTLIYKSSYIYYLGHPSSVPIGQMAYVLFGFDILEVSVEYYSLFPTVLLTSVIPLFFIPFKTNKKEFCIFAFYLILAFISLLFTVSKMTLITDLFAVFIIALVIVNAKYKSVNKITSFVIKVFLILFGIGFIIFFVNSQITWSLSQGLRDFISSNPLLDRLFNNNRLSIKYSHILCNCLNINYIAGLFIGPDWGFDRAFSNNWFVDLILTSGIFGLLFFVIAIVFGTKQMISFSKQENQTNYLKITVLAFVLVFFAFSLFNFDSQPLIYSDEIFPIFLCPLFLISVFFIGISFGSLKDKEGTPHEN